MKLKIPSDISADVLSALLVFCLHSSSVLLETALDCSCYLLFHAVSGRKVGELPGSDECSYWLQSFEMSQSQLFTYKTFGNS